MGPYFSCVPSLNRRDSLLFGEKLIFGKIGVTDSCPIGVSADLCSAGAP